MAGQSRHWAMLLMGLSLCCATLPTAIPPVVLPTARLSLRGGLDRPESAQFSVQHPPAEVAPAGAAGPGVGEDIPERERGPPVLYDDVAHRRSVRERDEWLWLFSSMASYRPIFPRSWIRDILEGEGCHCVDLNTLTFIAFLLDVYAHRIVDHAMDWAFVRLTGEEEDKGDADPKYKKQHVGDKILAGNFTVSASILP
jgi:hypothetical protein